MALFQFFTFEIRQIDDKKKSILLLYQPFYKQIIWCMPVLVIVLIAAMATAIIHTIQCVPSNVRICTVHISIRKDSTGGNFFSPPDHCLLLTCRLSAVFKNDGKQFWPTFTSPLYIKSNNERISEYRISFR